MIEAIIFDMDGVIIDSIPIHFRIWQEVGEKFGFPQDHDLFDEENGMDTPRISKLVVEKFNLGVSWEDIAAEKRRIAGERVAEGVKLFDEVDQTLTNLRRLGFKVGLATMTPRDHVEASLGHNMTTLEFDAIVTDSDVERSKPDPDVFLKCAEKLGVDPSGCVVIEDAINGIKAAKAAGMKAVAITNTTPAEKFTLADAVISNLKEINQDLIDRLGGDE